MSEQVNYKFWTVCLIQDKNKLLLLDKRHDNVTGFIPPGGKVDFPESFVECAIREVKEETGLEVSNLVYKGVYEYVNIEKKDRYIIFNYITKDFTGALLTDPPEGKPVWVDIKDIDDLPMRASIRRRIPLFFKEGTFEIQVEWDNVKNDEGKVRVSAT